ncbi:MAG: hypothetical protein ACRENE_06690 [Polyangiaceae bacterium]
MRSAWLLLLLGTAGCLALYQRSSSDPWPCANDADCDSGLVCRQLGGKPFACVGRQDCLVDSDCTHGDTCQVSFDCTSANGCQRGTCACDYPMSICNGLCSDMNSDASHCGSCGNQCPAGQVCNTGVCGCFLASDTLCGSVCVDTSNDPQNCGTCGARCTAYDGCTNGHCDCPYGQMRCGAVCTDVMTDTSNCGTCGNSCPAYGLYGGCSFGVCQ